MREEGMERGGMVPSAKHIQGDHDAIDVMRGRVAYVSAYVRAGKLKIMMPVVIAYFEWLNVPL